MVPTSGFHYPNRFKRLPNGDETNKIERTLIISPVFKVVHLLAGFQLKCVLTRERADRQHQYMVLARVPLFPSNHISKTLDRLPIEPVWHACVGGSHTEQAIAMFDMGIDHYYLHSWQREMWQKKSEIWNLWLAAAIVLRYQGFEILRSKNVFPFLSF